MAITKIGPVPTKAVRLSQRDPFVSTPLSGAVAESMETMTMGPPPLAAAQQLGHTMRSKTYLICYSVSSSGTMDLKSLIQTFAGAIKMPTLTDYKAYLVVLSNTPDLNVQDLTTDLKLVQRAKFQWRQILPFLHTQDSSGQTAAKSQAADFLSKLFGLLKPRSEVEKERSLALTTMRMLPEAFSPIASTANSYSNVAELMDRFLQSYPRELGALETYLKRLRVVYQIRGSGHKDGPRQIERDIIGFADPNDARQKQEESKKEEAEEEKAKKEERLPIIPAHGSCGTEVKFYYEPKDSAAGSGAHITVVEHIQRNKQMQASRPELPVLNIGTRLNPTYVLPEFCTLVPTLKHNASHFSFGEVAKRFGDEWVDELSIPAASRPPGLKLALVENLRRCQVTMTPTSLLLPYRPKESAVFSYYSGKAVSASTGAWPMPPVNSPHKKAPRIAVLTIGSSQDCSMQQAGEALKALKKQFKDHKMDFTQPDIPVSAVALPNRECDKKVQRSLRAALKVLKMEKVNIVIFVLPRKQEKEEDPAQASARMRVLHDFIKRLCDTELGLQSICVQATKFVEMNRGYLDHLVLKVNLKSCGRNQVFQPQSTSAIRLKDTMIVGVTIISPRKAYRGKKGTALSVAAIVTSRNGDITEWPGSPEVLGKNPWMDILSRIAAMQQQFQRGGKDAVPENVIIYVNGPADAACIDIMSKFTKPVGNKSLKATLIFVSKDHHADIQVLKPGSGAKEKEASTDAAVITRDNEDEKAWDFVMRCHAPRTASKHKAAKKDAQKDKPDAKKPPKYTKPVRYSVAYDDIFSEVNARGELEDLTHDMCYMSGCASSIIAQTLPIYYAELLRNRVDSYVTRWYCPEDKEPPTAIMDQSAINVHPNLAKTMFYV